MNQAKQREGNLNPNRGECRRPGCQWKGRPGRTGFSRETGVQSISLPNALDFGYFHVCIEMAGGCGHKSHLFPGKLTLKLNF